MHTTLTLPPATNYSDEVTNEWLILADQYRRAADCLLKTKQTCDCVGAYTLMCAMELEACIKALFASAMEADDADKISSDRNILNLCESVLKLTAEEEHLCLFLRDRLLYRDSRIRGNGLNAAERKTFRRLIKRLDRRTYAELNWD